MAGWPNRSQFATNNMKRSILLLLGLIAAVAVAHAQTKINAVTLIKPGGNSTMLITNSAGSVEWGSPSAIINPGIAIDISNGSTIDVDPTALTGLGATPDNTDFFMIYDVSGSDLKTTTYAEILGGVVFSISDGTNTQSINNTNTLLFNSTASDGYDFLVSATDRVSFAYDFTELSNLSSIDNVTDRLIIFDASAGTYNYVNPSQLAGTTYSFTISDGTNTQTVENGNTLFINDAANGIDVTVGSPDQVTIGYDITELPSDSNPDFAADFFMTYDASAGFHRKVLLGTIVAAPAENNVAIASNTSANTNIASGLTLTTYRYLQVFLDGVKQQQTNDWVTSGNNIQFTFATLAGQKLTVVGYK